MVTEAERTARAVAVRERVLRIGRHVLPGITAETSDAERIGARLHADDPHAEVAYAPIVALCVPATLVPSEIPERPYLYIDHAISWSRYSLVLGALVSAGLITEAEFERCFAARNTIVPAPGTYPTPDPEDHVGVDDIELVRQLTIQLEQATARIQALSVLEQQFASFEDTIETLRQQANLYRTRYYELSAKLDETRARLEEREANASAVLSW